MRSSSRTRLRFTAALAASLACASGAILAPLGAHAQPAPTEDAKKRAHEAFERGNAQSERGDYEAAAHSFAEADALAPNKVALESALDAAILANDVPLGAELLERAKRDPSLNADIMKRAHEAFDGKAGRIEIKCVDACVAKLDGATVDGTGIWAKVGPHHASIKEGEFSLDKDVTVTAGATLTLEVDRTPKAKPPENTLPIDPPKSTRILHPAFAYVGIGITAGLLGGTIGSAVDTKSIHDDFDAAPLPEKQALADVGISAQTRTNVLIGVTAGLGATTLALGLLAIPWGGSGASDNKNEEKKELPVSLYFSPTGASVRGQF